MALALIKEDGTGKADADTYADVADGDAYHEGHLYATAWTGASADQKAAALVMATRLIDGEYQFQGKQTTDSQSLSWPRCRCVDPDRDAAATIGRLPVRENWLPENLVPKQVMAATCEMARELLIADRTAAPAGEGLKYFNDGGEQTGYDKTDTRPTISHFAQALLARYGTLIKSASGAVWLVRS